MNVPDTAMEYRVFGGMGKKVSAVGMGTYYDPLWIVTAYLGWRRGSAAKLSALLKGYECGINLVDTAEVYGSEPIVGEMIKAVGRDNVFVATKVWSNHLRADALKKALQRSLARLGVGYVDLYQIHRPNSSVPIEETMHAMEDLISAGRIIDAGVSNFSLRQTVAANNALKKNQLLSTQMDYSLINRSIERDLVPYCVENKMNILAYYPLGHGKLVRSAAVVEIAKKLGKSPAQVALNWLVSKPYVYPIPRASQPLHVAENSGATGWLMPGELRGELERLFPSP